MKRGTNKTLFQNAAEERLEREQPLAARLRPRTLDDFVGQDHILAPGRLLRRAIQADRVSSLIFYGPPGTGKTTLASVIAHTTRSCFVALNAVLTGVADLRAVTAAAQQRYGEQGQRTILFVDEVHRWNKAQQDALLPWVENGTIILIGATTENPYFTVNRALVSRSRIFQLRPLTPEQLREVARRAIADTERGLGARRVRLEDAALDHLVDVANGDARGVLNALELAAETTAPDATGDICIDLAVAEESIQRRAVLYDKEGDYHFDTISAFIKSLRGSDPDAALYWLAKMVYAGEDPRFLFRRMLIFAGEDIGLADPRALTVALAGAEAFDRVGMPEGRYHLGMTALYLATAPKSNSVMGFFDALAAVEKEAEGEVPNHLKDGSRDKEGFGHGAGYLYPHAYRDHWVEQQYLPNHLQGRIFYQPGQLGHEREVGGAVLRRREALLAAGFEPGGAGAPPEILSTSPADRGFERWLQRTLSGAGDALAAARTAVFEAAGCTRHHVILDLGADSGLFTWEAVRQAPEGGVWARVSDAAAAARLAAQARLAPDLRSPRIITGPAAELRRLLAAGGDGEVCFDVVVGRNLFTRATDAARRAVLAEVAAVLRPGGRLVLWEVVPRHTQRLYRLLDPEQLDADLAARLARAEERVYEDPAGVMVNWDAGELAAAARAAGLTVEAAESRATVTQQQLTRRHLDRWFSDVPVDGRPSYLLHVRRELAADELTHVEAAFRARLTDRVVRWHGAAVLLCCTTSNGGGAAAGVGGGAASGIDAGAGGA